MTSRIVGSLAVGRLARPMAAYVAIFSLSLSFTATSFGAGAPLNPVSRVAGFGLDNSYSIFNATNGATANGAPALASFSGLNLSGTQTIAGTGFRRVAFNTVAELSGLGQPAALAHPFESCHDTRSSERGSWRSS